MGTGGSISDLPHRPARLAGCRGSRRPAGTSERVMLAAQTGRDWQQRCVHARCAPLVIRTVPMVTADGRSVSRGQPPTPLAAAGMAVRPAAGPTVRLGHHNKRLANDTLHCAWASTIVDHMQTTSHCCLPVCLSTERRMWSHPAEPRPATRHPSVASPPLRLFFIRLQRPCQLTT